VGFAINELGLYLDTHPEDGEALQQRNSYARMYKDAMQTYEQQNGPLSQNAVMDSKYGWLKSPWPWEAK
jgi:spore coat protein JB